MAPQTTKPLAPHINRIYDLADVLDVLEQAGAPAAAEAFATKALTEACTQYPMSATRALGKIEATEWTEKAARTSSAVVEAALAELLAVARAADRAYGPATVLPPLKDATAALRALAMQPSPGAPRAEPMMAAAGGKAAKTKAAAVPSLADYVTGRAGAIDPTDTRL